MGKKIINNFTLKKIVYLNLWTSDLFQSVWSIDFNCHGLHQEKTWSQKKAKLCSEPPRNLIFASKQWYTKHIFFLLGICQIIQIIQYYYSNLQQNKINSICCSLTNICRIFQLHAQYCITEDMFQTKETSSPFIIPVPGYPLCLVPHLKIFYVLVLSCVCYVFVRVCLYVLCGHLLGKGWPLGSRREFVYFPLVSWVRCGTWLYQFLIFAPFLTLLNLFGLY